MVYYVAIARRCSSMVEHGFRKAGVVGSSPTIGFFSVHEYSARRQAGMACMAHPAPLAQGGSGKRREFGPRVRRHYTVLTTPWARCRVLWGYGRAATRMQKDGYAARGGAGAVRDISADVACSQSSIDLRYVRDGQTTGDGRAEDAASGCERGATAAALGTAASGPGAFRQGVRIVPA